MLGPHLHLRFARMRMVRPLRRSMLHVLHHTPPHPPPPLSIMNASLDRRSELRTPLKSVVDSIVRPILVQTESPDIFYGNICLFVFDGFLSQQP